MPESSRKSFRKLVEEKKAEFNDQFSAAGELAKAARDRGEFRLVNEFVMEPYQGHGFRVNKGQVVHYELIDGPQILDTVYLVASRPTEE